MMNAATHFKLGLLTVITLITIAAISLVLVVRQPDTDSYHAYFDESVQGLEPGALVKFRGIRVGTVKSISFAPDHRLIDVELALDRGRAHIEDNAPNLRATTVVLGITGLKQVEIDFATPDTPPPPTLSFPPPRRYIPTRPSLISSLYERVDTIAMRSQVLVDKGLAAMDDVRALLKEATTTTVEARALVRRFDRVDLPAKTAAILTGFTTTLRQLDKTLISLGRGGQAMEDLGRRTQEASTDLDTTLRDVGDAARALRRFFDALEREPDMLLKGRARSRR